MLPGCVLGFRPYDENLGGGFSSYSHTTKEELVMDFLKFIFHCIYLLCVICSNRLCPQLCLCCVWHELVVHFLYYTCYSKIAWSLSENIWFIGMKHQDLEQKTIIHQISTINFRTTCYLGTQPMSGLSQLVILPASLLFISIKKRKYKKEQEREREMYSVLSHGS